MELKAEGSDEAESDREYLEEIFASLSKDN